MINSVTSKTKIHILELLSLRPRCLSELSDMTRISTQGISKHMRGLIADGLVKIVTLDRGNSPKSLIRAYYKINKPIYIVSGKGDEKLSIYMSSTTPKLHPIPKEKKRSTRVLADTEDELNQLKRKLRVLKNREARIFEEMTELVSFKDRIVGSMNCTPLEEYLLRAFMFSRNEDDLAEAAGYFGLKQEEVHQVLSKILG
ncbi:MAG: ArsR/SmtB family transcription factor [Nitrososphaerales archaeon]